MAYYFGRSKTVTDFVRTSEFKSHRNRYECKALANAVDRFTKDFGYRRARKLDAREVLLRRMAKVQRRTNKVLGRLQARCLTKWRDVLALVKKCGTPQEKSS